MTDFHLATFQAEVTPAPGSPLCGGWITPVQEVADPLYALGLVLIGPDDPLVLCAVDWCEICNGDHVLWRETLAKAARTTPERVAVQCVHQHNAPLTDLQAQQRIRDHGITPDLMDADGFRQALARTAAAVQDSLRQPIPVTHVGSGQARVEQIASNRRVMGPDGNVKAVRWSRCPEPELRAEPEGLIDPFLKSISFWNESRKVAVLHYYAVHPMSYYGDGRVTGDFVGLARARRTQEDEGAVHITFTGAAGDVTAGKYNDGTPDNRARLMERLHSAMVESERHTERSRLERLDWRIQPVLLPPHPQLNLEEEERLLADTGQPTLRRKTAALKISFLRRQAAQLPIPLTCLHLNDNLCLLHLPGEPFVAYQLYAQEQRPDAFVAVAGYGDLGPGYLPLEQSFAEGGYEVTAAFAAPESEYRLKQAIQQLVAGAVTPPSPNGSLI
jgi:hypothetical protein